MNPKLPNSSWQKNCKEINSKLFKQLIKWAILPIHKIWNIFYKIYFIHLFVMFNVHLFVMFNVHLFVLFNLFLSTLFNF